MLDGTGAEAVRADVAVAGDRVLFVGDAASEGITAADTVDVTGLGVAPGFIDMHSHAELDSDHGRDARAFLYQGITTVALGLDGGYSTSLVVKSDTRALSVVAYRATINGLLVTARPAPDE